MKREMLAVLVACSVAGCAAPRMTEVATSGAKPDGCAEVAGVRSIKVVYNASGEPIGVAPDRRSGEEEIGDPGRLEVRECEIVRINLKKGVAGRSGMVVFDKDMAVTGTATAFRSPGRRPAYLSRRNSVFIPIDDRATKGREEFSYSVHIDCPEQSACTPLDPMIIVER